MRDLLIICYHAVSDSFPASMSLPAGQLEAQVGSLVDRGYRPATFSDAVRSDSNGPTLSVTFDDGYRSVSEAALPVLSRLGVPATVFVPTAFMGSRQPMTWPGIDRWLSTGHERELVPMGWKELETLSNEGWEIGSHTRSHPRLTRVDDSQLKQELESSRGTLEERLDAPCTAIAYPYGDVDRRVARAAQEAGYLVGAALAAHQLRADPMRWPRVGAYREDSFRRFTFKTSKLARRAGLARLRHPFAQA
jgi:peptidoglycan/xylan/chitin deacetylase (PgdA/CDA1 family)